MNGREEGRRRSESRTFLNDSLTNLEWNEGGKQVKKKEEDEELKRSEWDYSI